MTLAIGLKKKRLKFADSIFGVDNTNTVSVDVKHAIVGNNSFEVKPVV